MIEIENVESYKIELPDGNLIFYPVFQEMIFEYYDKIEDEDYEVLIWNKDGFQTFNTPFDKDKYLTIFKNYEETLKWLYG